MLDLFSWGAGILVGAFFTILATEPVHYLVATTLGPLAPKRKRDLTGIWKTRYEYFSKGESRVEEHLFRIRQFGKYVVGKNITANSHWYQMKGKLDAEVYVTGTWRNANNGNLYHGAFQFVVDPEGVSMAGRWVGFNSRHEILSGPWSWRFLERSTSKKSIRKVLEELEEHNEALHST